MTVAGSLEEHARQLREAVVTEPSDDGWRTAFLTSFVRPGGLSEPAAPRLVRRNDPVVKVTLESGADIVCTPDHRFMLRDGTYREAQQLKAKDQLMPFARTAIPERLHRTGAFPIPASLSQKVSKVEPAGRADVYDLTVDLTQNFALAAGVFVHNSIDDDPPAHMRYTEARLAAISTEMLADIEKETVDWMPNYDNRHQQPTVLPARVPNLIVNGSAGIAVGMATNIPPHNLREIVAATKRLIDDPELTTDDLCETVVGPDFPGGGVIYRFDEQRNVETGAAERVDAIRRAYAQGRGRIIARAKAHNEQLRGNRDAIIVTELPYAVNKASLIEKIADLVQNKKLAGISDIRDESDREGMRIVIEIKRDDDKTLVLNNLFKHTAMQSAFNFNMLALVDQQPRTLSLKEILAPAITMAGTLPEGVSFEHAQIGNVLIGLATGTKMGSDAMLFYLLTYLFANLGAWAIIIAVSEAIGSEEIDDYSGLGRRSPFLAFAMLIFLLSLAGVPPLAGFFSKDEILGAVFARARESPRISTARAGA